MLTGVSFLWAFVAITIISAIALLINASKKEEQRSGITIVLLFIVFFASLIMTIISFGTSHIAVAGYDLEDNHVYYLQAIVVSKDNPENTNLIVQEVNVITGAITDPVITIHLPKNKLTDGVKSGKYIKKNSQDKIEVWEQPIKT